MREKVRLGQLEVDGRDPDERYGNAPETHIWQAHVHEEEARNPTRLDAAGSPIHHWAEEYADCAMRGVDATPNEFQLAEQQGDAGWSLGAPAEIDSAGDIAGG